MGDLLSHPRSNSTPQSSTTTVCETHPREIRVTNICAINPECQSSENQEIDDPGTSKAAKELYVLPVRSSECNIGNAPTSQDVPVFYDSDYRVHGRKSIRKLQLTDLPCTLLQEIYGWVPHYVCSHTAVCKWFNDILPESKAVELRVLRRRGVREQYLKRFFCNSQRVHLVVRDHNPNFESCVMRSIISLFSPAVGNLISIDLSGALMVRCPCGLDPDKRDELEKARERVVFYTTALIKYATRLEVLSVKDNGLSDQSCMMLTAGLSERTGLRELDLSNNRFQVMGIIALSAAICRNRGLERLSIAGNEIAQDAIDAVAMALAGCPRLTDLDMGGNDLAVAAFFPCIAAATALRRLALAGTFGQARAAIQTAMLLGQVECPLVSLDLS
eukprot:CAMPEP_0172152216 /NCGR_PEP_ID=MMETSP1050-20130122/709_1 /TAXON_ID=233186 /ORGANISM="Cryptomonas curvata, Strain CCAP979/52" /LENGTH=387 /DNA_ID=CAMNT_0012820503 /DNA_START=67 /DNA_END=1227 /DNA_ORIENTATION=+